MFFFSSILQIATNACKALGISDKDLQSCIFDVAVTNDTSFTNQESYKQSMLRFYFPYFDTFLEVHFATRVSYPSHFNFYLYFFLKVVLVLYIYKQKKKLTTTGGGYLNVLSINSRRT